MNSNAIKLRIDMEVFGIRTSARNAILNAGITTAEELREKVLNLSLAKYRNCGSVTINEAKRFLGLPSINPKDRGQIIDTELAKIRISLGVISKAIKMGNPNPR